MNQDALWVPLILAALGVMAGFVLVFFILEIPGLRVDKGPMTLSWSVRRWLGIYPNNPKRRRWAVPVFIVLWGLCLCFMLWFGYHIIYQGPVAEAHFVRLK